MNPGHHRWHATCRHGHGITSRRRCNAAQPTANMKYAREFITSTVVGGLFIVVPVYLAVLLLLKGMKSVGSLVRPIAALVPDWLPAESLLSLLLVLGALFPRRCRRANSAGRAVRERIERVFFERLPGIRPAAQLDAAIGGRRRGADVAAGAGGDRGRAGSGLHHRRARRRSIHGLRAVGAHAARRAPCMSWRGNACTSSTSLYPGDQIHLSLGLRVERPRGRDAGNASPRQ